MKVSEIKLAKTNKKIKHETYKDKEYIQIAPSDKIFEKLGFNNCNFVDILSEFIDNSISAMNGNSVNVDITVGGKWEKETKKEAKLDLINAYLEIKDDACGIPKNKLADALSPAATAGNSYGLNEHGIGMKSGIASLGSVYNFSLLTKTKDENIGRKITELKHGKIEIQKTLCDFAHGTVITISTLQDIVKVVKSDYTRLVVDQLGAKYRNYLVGTEQNKKLNLNLRLVDENGKIIWNYKIKPVAPLYKDNSPEFRKKRITGNGWSALITVGLSASSEEHETMNGSRPSTSHPYTIWGKKLDFIMHDKIIKQYSIDSFVKQSYNNLFCPLVGEVILLEGFQTAMTKDGIRETREFLELKDQINKEIMPIISKRNADYSKDKEHDYRDQLAKILSNLNKDIKKEYSIEGTGGKVDLLVDGEPWELKADQADAQSAYQLLCYMDFLNKDNGQLIANSFANSAKEAVEKIYDLHKKTIVMKTLSDFNLGPIKSQ